MRVCADLDIPLTTRALHLRARPGDSLEALAREARYRACAEVIGADDVLLTAHTQDDQAETLLLALLRGSGLQGLAAMPVVARLGPGRLVRPLLTVTRAELVEQARARGLSWIDDPSNRLERMDRNYLRHRVMPLLRARWPSADLTLSRSAGHCAEAAAVLDGLARDLLPACAGSRPGTLRIDALAALGPPRQRLLLRAWLRERGFRMPDSRHLARILGEVVTAGPDADPLVAWEGCEVRRFRKDLHALRPLPSPPDPGLVIHWEWRADTAGLVLPAGLGRLIWPDAVQCTGATGPAIVRFGVTGQSCRPDPRDHRRPLKKRFQDAGIPRWLRPYVPLVFVDGRLIAVAGVGVCVEPDAGTTTARPCDPGPTWVEHPWTGHGFFKGLEPADRVSEYGASRAESD